MPVSATRKTRRRMRASVVEVVSAGRNLRGQAQPLSFSLRGIGLEGDEVEIVLRRHLLQPRVDHRLEPLARQGEGVDGRAKRERDRIAGGFVVALAARDFAPPREPDRREIGIARAKARLTDFIIEACERYERVAGGWRCVERAQPLIAGVFAREAAAIFVGFRQRAAAGRAAVGHGAAIRAAATRRSSDRMTL